MARRIAALAGFMTVIALALMLLYRVYLHHTQTAPDREDGTAIVELNVELNDEAAATAKIYSTLA